MAGRPNPDAPECSCGTLERLVNEPAVPIEFDPALNEYHILGSDGGQVMIYHCPFCGGRTAKSRRDQLFTHITHAESERLRRITQDLKTLPDVLARFGPPERDSPAQTGTIGTDEEGRPRTDFYRALTYSNLSPMAQVRITVYPNDRVHFTFYGKPVDGGKKT